MITVARCSTVDEAMMLRALLEASGIEVFIPDELTASVVPHHFITRSGVRVQVPDEQAEEARRILESQN
jgi:hypothetical protein